jgi:hypothetical protein
MLGGSSIMANKNFIEKLHDGFNFPIDVLREYIEENTGIKFAGFTKITEGYSNEVYDIGEFMVKVRRESEVPFSCIKWAVDECKRENIKTINIVHCGKISGLDVMIEEKIHGKPLTPNLYEEAGAELKKFHRIGVEGFWRRRENGKFDFANYKDLAESNTRGRLEDLPLICSTFGAEDIENIKTILRQYEKLNSVPVLCHGDYAPKHILCGETINGIIDMGDFQGGSGYCDLAYFSFNTDEKHFHKFLAGYGKIDERELFINKVIQLIGHAAHSRRIEDEPEAEKLEMKLFHLLRGKASPTLS